MTSFSHGLRRRLWALGVDVSRFRPRSHPVARQRLLLAAQAIGVVFDVGASDGEWASVLRDDVGFTGLICSFEPTSNAFKLLQKRARTDPNWTVFNCALGDTEGRRAINIAGNSQSSSMLGMLATHEQAAPESPFIGSETVRVRTLDGIFDELCPPGERVYLKIDTQGYERHVLSGARRSLDKIDLVQIEMSLVPLYEDQPSLLELLQLMFEQGFDLIGIDPGFTHPKTGQLLQIDGVFRKVTQATLPQDGTVPRR